MDKIDYPSFVRDRCTVPYRSAPGFAPPSARGNADTAAAEIDQIPEWFSQFLNDRQTRKPSAHTMKAYRQGFIAIATLVAGGDPSRLAVTDITKDTMRNAFAAYARDHEAASIRRWWSTWNVLCTFLYTGERLVANPMQLVGQPRLAKPLPKALPRTAVEALLEAVATDQDFKRQTDWAEPDLALILTALLAVLRAEELHQADVGDIRTTDDGAAVITSKAKAARSAACPSRPNCCRSSRHSSPAERSASPALQSAKRTSRLPPYRDGPHDPAVRRPRRRTYHPRNIAIANQTGLQAGRPRRSTGPRGPSPRAAAHLRHRTSRLGCQRLHPDEAARAPTKSTTSAKRPATQAVSSTPTAPKHSERCTACTRSKTKYTSSPPTTTTPPNTYTQPLKAMTSAPVMTSTPAARAAVINGVSDGSATTSNTVRVGDRSLVEGPLARLRWQWIPPRPAATAQPRAGNRHRLAGKSLLLGRQRRGALDAGLRHGDRHSAGRRGRRDGDTGAHLGSGDGARSRRSLQNRPGKGGRGDDGASSDDG